VTRSSSEELRACRRRSGSSKELVVGGFHRWRISSELHARVCVCEREREREREREERIEVGERDRMRRSK
jgi:hypothetical protein